MCSKQNRLKQFIQASFKGFLSYESLITIFLIYLDIWIRISYVTNDKITPLVGKV